MKTYKITKYNPSKRNEQGHYLDNNEWTSISDLKNLDEYFKVESAYVNAILTILQHFKISRLYAVFIEKHTNEEDFNSFDKLGYLNKIQFNYKNDIENLSEGLELNLEKIDKYSRLILRELVWFKLMSNEVKIKFGYDYYMYIETKELPIEIIQQIENSGLFVE